MCPFWPRSRPCELLLLYCTCFLVWLLSLFGPRKQTFGKQISYHWHHHRHLILAQSEKLSCKLLMFWLKHSVSVQLANEGFMFKHFFWPWMFRHTTVYPYPAKLHYTSCLDGVWIKIKKFGSIQTNLCISRIQTMESVQTSGFAECVFISTYKM